MQKDAPVMDPVAAVALLDEPNRQRLYRFVTSNGGAVGRDEAASALGISRELAAFHLDRLVAGGLLETEYRRLTGRSGPGAGRPAKLYRRSAHDVTISIPPRRYDHAAHVFAEALGRLDGTTGTDAVADVARQLGTEIGTAARRRAGARPSHRRLVAALLNELDQAGYEPVIDKADGAVTLRNCPYRVLAASHRALTCGMNVAWAEAVVAALKDSKLDVEFSLAPDRCCVVLREARAVSPH